MITTRSVFYTRFVADEIITAPFGAQKIKQIIPGAKDSSTGSDKIKKTVNSKISQIRLIRQSYACGIGTECVQWNFCSVPASVNDMASSVTGLSSRITELPNELTTDIDTCSPVVSSNQCWKDCVQEI